MKADRKRNLKHIYGMIWSVHRHNYYNPYDDSGTPGVHIRFVLSKSAAKSFESHVRKRFAKDEFKRANFEIVKFVRERS